MIIGLVTSAIVWVLFAYLPKRVWPFNRVDDALGVVYTHGFAGLLGGLLIGLLADPKMIVYLGIGSNPDVSTTGLFYGHPRQLLIQAGAALAVIVRDAPITLLLLPGIRLFITLQMSGSQLVAVDIKAHGEVAYPADEPTLEPDFGDIPGEPVPVHHHHHELVTPEGRVLVTSGGKARPEDEDMG